MDHQAVQGITLEDVLVEGIKDQTVELSVTDHLVLRITPHDWENGTLILPEALFIRKNGVESLKKKVRQSLK